MKKLILTVLFLITAIAGAQSNQAFIQKQYWASDFGTWQILGQSANTYNFPAALCKIPGPAGAEPFMPFATNAKVYIQDANTAHSELLTVNSVISNESFCGISISPSYSHYSFSVLSGTAGLQEVLNQISSNIPYAVQVVLDRNWYTAVNSIPGQTAAAAIAAAKGSTAAILVNQTTVPQSYYSWNGSAYVLNTVTGSTLPATTLVYKGTNVLGVAQAATPGTDYVIPSGNIAGTAGNLSGTPALPNGTTVSTQTTGDNSGKAASDAFVIANAGGAAVPATPLVLKGNNSINGVVPATPGTDYLIPSAIPSTSAVLKGNGTAGASVAAVPAVDFLAPYTTGSMNPLGTATTGTNYGSNVFEFSSSYCTTSSPCNQANDEFGFQTFISSGPNPTNWLQLGHSGTSGYAAFNIAVPTQFNGYAFMNALGGATTGTNYGSSEFEFSGSYCTTSSPCNPASDEWLFQSYMGTGPNPTTNLLINHSGTPGVSQVIFDSPVVVPTIATGNNSGLAASTANTFNSMPSVSAAYFGAYGDAYQLPDGCTTTASNTTINCRDAPFVSTDAGKQIWVQGAGAAGVAFHGAITSVTNSGAVVVTPAPSTSVAYAPLNIVYGHDDVTAVQACFQYAANNSVTCTLRALPPITGGISNTGNTGFLIGSGGLQLAPSYLGSASSFTGSGPTGTSLFCEYNGDCLSLAPGPIVGAIVSNIFMSGDPTQPSGRALHFNAAGISGGAGGLWDSTFSNIQIQNFALECMWMDGGGGVGYGYNLPNQIDTFNQFECDGPYQSHPANLIKITGQAAQILFQNGQANGTGWTQSGSGGSTSASANYPNPLIYLGEKTMGLSDSPGDVKFYGYTFEVGTQGLQVGEGTTNIHFDNSYIEDVSTPLIAYNSPGLTFSGNHIANSGNISGIAQFTGTTIGGMRDNLEYGGLVTPAALAVCTGTGNNIDFAGNSLNGIAQTSTNCVTSTASPSTATLTVTGGTSVSVAADATPITTIAATGINPGKTLTLYATGTFSLATGGNITLGGYASPLVIPTGGSVVLTLLDQGATWLVTSATGATVPTVTNLAGGAVGSVPYQSAANTTAFVASPTTSGHTFVYVWQPSGSAIAPTSLDLATYLASPPAIGGSAAAAGSFTTLAASAGFTATSDGVHAGYQAFVGNTANQAVVSNTWGLMGPAEATYTAWAEQPANTTSSGPSVLGFKEYGPVSSGVSQWNLVQTTGTGNVVLSTAPAITGTLTVTSTLPGTIYSVAGTALPTCNTGAKGLQAIVSDATSPTYLGAYTGSGAVASAVLCNGSGWVTH